MKPIGTVTVNHTCSADPQTEGEEIFHVILHTVSARLKLYHLSIVNISSGPISIL